MSGFCLFVFADSGEIQPVVPAVEDSDVVMNAVNGDAVDTVTSQQDDSLEHGQYKLRWRWSLSVC